MSRCLSLQTVCWLLLGAAVFPFKLQAAEQHWQSPSSQATLVELYTSEGCSSCPPADHWLSSLANRGDLWSQVIPVAFHVDYWNYLGWPDKYASAQYSQRQRLHRQQRNTRSVYTPGFVVNGREWRGFFGRKGLPGASAKNVGVLSAGFDTATQHFQARFNPTVAVDGTLELHVALLAMNVNSAVSRGENAGRKLHHDFVVLKAKRLRGRQDKAAFEWQSDLDVGAIKGEKVDAIALWVTEANSLVPLQVAGGLITY